MLVCGFDDEPSSPVGVNEDDKVVVDIISEVGCVMFGIDVFDLGILLGVSVLKKIVD